MFDEPDLEAFGDFEEDFDDSEAVEEYVAEVVEAAAAFGIEAPK